MPISAGERKKVFVSYSHRDRDWLERLQVHLRPLERRGPVELWDDTKIRPGDEWRKEISNALDSAKVAVLLISSDFLASDFIAENELPPLLAAAEKDGVLILPLILKPSLFEETESLSKFQSVNPPSEALINLSPGKQEEYFVKLSKAILHAIEEAQTKLVGASGAGRLPIFNLPFSRNKFFTGRDDILKGVHKNFNAGERAQALNGLGGIGKTQTAVEYAYRHRQDYEVVLWAGANTRETLVADYAAIAGLLDLPEKNAQDQGEAVAAAKRWLENNSNWLLILDNADKIEIADEFIPSCEAGHVLLTTRAHAMGAVGMSNELEKMTPEEGALFLLRRLRKVKKDDALESATAEIRAQAEALSTLVDGLPLALDQAAAFIEEKPSTFEQYQTLYHSERKELLRRRGKLAKDHPSVTVTFLLAFQKVADDDSAAADLLRVCAFLEANSIPEEIFSEGAKELGEALSSIAGKPLKLSDAIEEAARYSLIRRHPEDRTLSLHRLAQDVLRDEMDDGTRRVWAERAVRAVNEVFPDAEYSNWLSCNRLIRHAQALAPLVEKCGFDFPEAARLLNKAGHYLNDSAQYAGAETLFKRALAIREKVLGADHRDVAISLNNLAVLYQRQGRHTDLEPLHKRALAIFEKALGAEHPDVAISLDNLASLYKSQARYAEAEPLYKRALAIAEKAPEAEHTRIAHCLDHLGMFYQSQDRYAEAEPLLLRAVAILEKTPGTEHLVMAHCLSNLASLYKSQARYAEAEPLLLRAVAILEKTPGAEHPVMAHCLSSLASLYKSQARYAEAEPLYKRALAIREEVLGANYIIILLEYGILLIKTGRASEAANLWARGSAARKKS